MLYKNIHDNDVRYGAPTADADLVGGGQFFWATKRLFDVALSLFLLPILISAAIAIILLNPFLNRGSLLFFQKRMGRNCLPFYAIKFRSMTKVAEIIRAHDDPIELDQITWLGRFMRRTRIDELPQILNVLKGEMSLIGPRPDFYEHAWSPDKIGDFIQFSRFNRFVVRFDQCIYWIKLVDRQSE